MGISLHDFVVTAGYANLPAAVVRMAERCLLDLVGTAVAGRQTDLSRITALAPDFLNQDFGSVTASDYLLRHVPFTEVEHLVDAIVPTTEVFSLLGLKRHEPCLRLVRTAHLGRRRITHVKLIHPSSAFRLGGRSSATDTPGGVA